MYREFSGGRRVFIHELHRKYGGVVRLGPGEVSFLGVDDVRGMWFFLWIWK